MQNKDHSIPQSNVTKHHIINTDFPIEKPIFWGPNQFTEYPDEYNPPSNWRPNDLLALPRVVRFFFGGNEAALKEQFIHLGYVNYTYVHSGLKRPCFPSPDIFQYRFYTDFVPDVEIADPPYNANKSTSDVLDDVMILTAHGKAGDAGGENPHIDGLFDLTYISRVDTNQFCGPTAFPFIIGSFMGAGPAMPPPSVFATSAIVWTSTLQQYGFDPLFATAPNNIPYWFNRIQRTIHIWLTASKSGALEVYKLTEIFGPIGWDQPPSVTPSTVSGLTVTGLTMDFP